MPDWRDPEEYAYTETLHVHDWAWEFLRRSPDYRTAWQEYQEVLARAPEPPAPSWNVTYRFLLYEPVDPSIPAPEAKPKWTEWVDVVLQDIEDYEELYGDGVPDFLERVVFDLGKPLDPQLDIARSFLQSVQKSELGKVLPTPRFKRKMFPTYLRLLDAEDACVSLGEMGRVLYPGKFDGQRSAKRRLQAAKSLVQGDWKLLLLLAK